MQQRKNVVELSGRAAGTVYFFFCKKCLGIDFLLAPPQKKNRIEVNVQSLIAQKTLRSHVAQSLGGFRVLLKKFCLSICVFSLLAKQRVNQTRHLFPATYFRKCLTPHSIMASRPYTVFENHAKSLIFHLRKWSIWRVFRKTIACGQTVLPDKC